MANIVGTPGNDNLVGFFEVDTIVGGDGDDRIVGREGDDQLFGGAGNDFFLWRQGDGSDFMDGGPDDGAPGFDTARFNLADGPGVGVLIEDDLGFTSVNSVGFDVSLVNVERIVVDGQDGDDSLVVTATDISGLRGVNFAGGRGQDVADGSASSLKMVFNGGEGDDILTGGEINDILRGDEAQDTRNGGNGDDILLGGDGDDDLNGEAGDDLMFGGQGQDDMSGGDDDDRLFGEDGDDLLQGNDGNDVLIGGQHQDTLIGGDGNDRLIGQQGDDLMTGGDGGDVFIFDPNSGHDRITDFEVGLDVLRFNGVGIGLGDLAFQDVGGDLKISITTSLNGDDITLFGLAGTSSGDIDFIFA